MAEKAAKIVFEGKMGFLENIQEKTQYLKEKIQNSTKTQGFGKVENAVCRKRV